MHSVDVSVPQAARDVVEVSQRIPQELLVKVADGPCEESDQQQRVVAVGGPAWENELGSGDRAMRVSDLDEYEREDFQEFQKACSDSQVVQHHAQEEKLQSTTRARGRSSPCLVWDGRGSSAHDTSRWRRKRHCWLKWSTLSLDVFC